MSPPVGGTTSLLTGDAVNARDPADRGDHALTGSCNSPLHGPDAFHAKEWRAELYDAVNARDPADRGDHALAGSYNSPLHAQKHSVPKNGGRSYTDVSPPVGGTTSLFAGDAVNAGDSGDRLDAPLAGSCNSPLHTQKHSVPKNGGRSYTTPSTPEIQRIATTARSRARITPSRGGQAPLPCPDAFHAKEWRVIRRERWSLRLFRFSCGRLWRREHEEMVSIVQGQRDPLGVSIDNG